MINESNSARPMIRLASPDIRDDDIECMVSVLRSGMLVQGTQVTELETELSVFASFGHCSLCSSGTAALHLALLSLGVRSGDAVLVPAFSFPATANVVELLGGQSVFYDVSSRTYSGTADAIAAAIAAYPQERMRGVIVVEEFGSPVDIQAISQICKGNSLFLLEDAACALGTIADGHHVGWHSDAACFSFHPRKAVTSGEGGAVLSRDKDLVDRIKVLRNHGIFRSDDGVDFIEPGFNYRLTDFQAAMIRGQLHRFGEELRRRRELANVYANELDSCKEISLPYADSGHAWQSYMVVLDSSLSRNKIIVALRERGIEANLGAYSIPLLDYYRRMYGHEATAFPVASYLFEQGLVLPLYGTLADDDIRRVCRELKQAIYISD